MFATKKMRTLEKELGNENFLLRGAVFIEKGSIKFITKKEALDFLIKFLLVESIAGTNYSLKDMSRNVRRIKKLVKNNSSISSEDIPVLLPKRQADKVLSNVFYKLEGNVCKYEKDCI